MSKHTKGPWFVDEMTSISPADDLSLEIASVQNIDNVSGKWMFLEESQANARLIAAAPELLHALEMLVLFSRRTNTNAAALTNAYLIIEKARGEA